MNKQELSFTEFLSKDNLVSKLDEMALELDLLKMKHKECQSERMLYEKLYRDAVSRLWKVGLCI